MAASTLTDPERLDRLRLIRSETVGPRTFRQLLDRYGTARRALEALPDLAARAGRSVRVAPEGEAEAEIEALRRLGAVLIAHDEAAYPQPLAAIDDPPPLIAVRGDLAALARPMVAIVGARNASAAGLRFAAVLARGLGEAGFIVASGLARGIDGAAHKAALDHGTAAVLAGGLARVYPPEHAELAERIVATGCLVSEMPVGWTATARDFPSRNRIVSGLSYGVVVVEAALRSGSLITARLANEQGREVFAVPGSPLDPRADGTNRLIRDGATLTTGAADVIEALQPLLTPPPRDPFARRAAEAAPLPGPAAPEPAAPRPASPPPRAGSGPARETLTALLSPSPVSVDDLIRTSSLAPRVVQTILLELELEGAIQRHGDSRVSLLPR